MYTAKEWNELEAKAEEYHNQYHLCEAKLLSHQSIIGQMQTAYDELVAERDALSAGLEAMMAYRIPPCHDSCPDKPCKANKSGDCDRLGIYRAAEMKAQALLTA